MRKISKHGRDEWFDLEDYGEIATDKAGHIRSPMFGGGWVIKGRQQTTFLFWGRIELQI